MQPADEQNRTQIIHSRMQIIQSRWLWSGRRRAGGDVVLRCCLAGLAGEGGGEVSAVVNADLAEDGLGVVAHGVGR